MKHITLLVLQDAVSASIADPCIMFNGVNEFLKATGSIVAGEDKRRDRFRSQHLAARALAYSRLAGCFWQPMRTLTPWLWRHDCSAGAVWQPDDKVLTTVAANMYQFTRWLELSSKFGNQRALRWRGRCSTISSPARSRSPQICGFE